MTLLGSDSACGSEISAALRQRELEVAEVPCLTGCGERGSQRWAAAMEEAKIRFRVLNAAAMVICIEDVPDRAELRAACGVLRTCELCSPPPLPISHLLLLALALRLLCIPCRPPPSFCWWNPSFTNACVHVAYKLQKVS